MMLRTYKLFTLATFAACPLALSSGCKSTSANTEANAGATQANVDPHPVKVAVNEPINAKNEMQLPQLDLTKLYFDFDSDVLRPEGRKDLHRIAEILQAVEGATVTIEGHCDDRGTPEYNLALGERRARSISEYLVRLGVRPERLGTISYGKERPAVAGNGENSWALNRRGEIVPVVASNRGETR